jgi:CubicO group peptidase (beta-lactamase class C family)
MEWWELDESASVAVSERFSAPYMGLAPEILASYLRATGDRLGAGLHVIALDGDDTAVRGVVAGDRGAVAVQLIVDSSGFATSAIGVPVSRVPIELPRRPTTGVGALGWFADLAAAAAEDLDLVGFSGAVVDNGMIAHQFSVGSADQDAAVTSETRFGWGSVTKPVTALGVLMLASRGEIDLDRPANDYLEAFSVEGPDGASPITVRNLLTHTAGGLDIGALPIYAFGAGPYPTQDVAYAPTLRALAPPGRKVTYDNLAFAALGQIIADLTGRPYAEWLCEELFVRLGCRSATFAPYSGSPDERRFVRIAERCWPVERYAIVPEAAGALRCSSLEMATVLVALSTNGGGVLPAEVVDGLFTSQSTDIPHGLGLPLSSIGDLTIGFHTGGGPGIASVIAVAPSRGTAIALVTNTDDSHLPRPAHDRLQRLAGEVLDRLLR